MRHKKRLGLSFLVISLLSLLISFNPILTGDVIGTDISAKTPYFYFISLTFFILSLLIFTSKQSLEAVIIPTGTLEADILRADTAVKEKNRLKKKGYFVISGYYPHGNLGGIRQSQDYRIYKRLREQEPPIIPAEMMVEGQAHDTLENTLYSLKKIRQRANKEGKTGTLDVGIVTYHGHFKRFKDYYEKAVEKGMLEKDDFRLHEIPTPETEEDREYEASPLRQLSHGFKLASIGKYRARGGGIKHAKPNPFSRFINKARDVLR